MDFESISLAARTKCHVFGETGRHVGRHWCAAFAQARAGGEGTKGRESAHACHRTSAHRRGTWHSGIPSASLGGLAKGALNPKPFFFWGGGLRCLEHMVANKRSQPKVFSLESAGPLAPQHNCFAMCIVPPQPSMASAWGYCRMGCGIRKKSRHNKDTWDACGPRLPSAIGGLAGIPSTLPNAWLHDAWAC